MRGHDVEHALAIVHAAAGFDRVAEHDLFAAVVARRREHEPRSLARLHRPTGERASDVDDVLLCVAAVDAEGMQLHQLAGVILVDPAAIAAAAHRQV